MGQNPQDLLLSDLDEDFYGAFNEAERNFFIDLSASDMPATPQTPGTATSAVYQLQRPPYFERPVQNGANLVVESFDHAIGQPWQPHPTDFIQQLSPMGCMGQPCHLHSSGCMRQLSPVGCNDHGQRLLFDNGDCSQLPKDEKSLPMDSYILAIKPKLEEAKPSILPLPTFHLSFKDNPGFYNFKASIPKQTDKYGGPRPKWYYSHLANKLFTSKDVFFPINITADPFPTSAHLVIYSVFTSPAMKTIPVERCYLCKSKEPNSKTVDHMIQVEPMENLSPEYILHNERHMVHFPLPPPPPGDESSQILAKLTCLTSDPGGPNRRPFSMVFALVKDRVEVGRQIIDTKCCVLPHRDKKREEILRNQNASLEPALPSSSNGLEQRIDHVKRVATSIAVENKVVTFSSRTSHGKVVKPRRKNSSILQPRMINEEMPTMMIPKRFQKKIKKYLEMLYIKEQRKNFMLCMLYSSTESEE